MKRPPIFSIPTLCTLMVVALTSIAFQSTAQNSKTYSANLVPYNHTADHIEVYVNDNFGGHMSAYSGGGSFVCCVSYPAVWYPGLSAKVRWATSSGIPGDRRPEAYIQVWHEKTVEIEKYETPGTALNVHFLGGENVRLIISSKGAGAKDYPGPDYPLRP